MAQIEEYAVSLRMQDFDNKLLKPKEFLGLCELLGVPSKKMYDKYYFFVFSRYGETLLDFRMKNNLNQKQLAKIIGISPVDLGFFEKEFKYPSRVQYLKIKEVLKKYANRKTSSST